MDKDIPRMSQPDNISNGNDKYSNKTNSKEGIHAVVTGTDDPLQHPQEMVAVQAGNSTAAAAVATGT